MWGFFVLGIFAVGFIIFAIIGTSGNDEASKEQRDFVATNNKRLKSLIEENEIADNIKFISYEQRNGAIIEETTQKLHLINSEKQQNSYCLYNYSMINIPLDKIISSEVIIDNETYSQTSRGSQMASIAAGGLLAGGIGAVIGGLSSKTKNVAKFKNIDIKLTIEDLQNPIQKINFLNREGGREHFGTDSGRKKDHPLVKQALEDVEKWQGMFDVILKQQIG